MNLEQLRPADVAPLLGLSPSRIYQLIDAGALPAVKGPGRTVRIPRAAWEAWLAEQAQRAVQEQQERQEAAR